MTDRAHLHRMAQALQSLAWPVAAWTLEGQVVYANAAFRAQWGCDEPKALEGDAFCALWGCQPDLETIGAAVQAGGSWVGELRAGPEEAARAALLAASLVEGDQGAEPLIVGCFVDITGRERWSDRQRWQLDRLRALREIDRGILAARSPRAIAEAALIHVQQLIPCQGTSVTLLTDDGERARYLAAVPAPEEEEWSQAAIPLAGFEPVIQDLQSGKLRYIDDPRDLAVAAEVLEAMERLGPSTHALVPLLIAGELMGSLNLLLSRGDRLTGPELAVAWEVADSLAVAIRQAALNQAVARQRQRLQVLTARLAEQDEAQRRHLAADLHDEIGQNLTALGINLSVLKAELTTGAGAGAGPAGQLAPRLDDSIDLLKRTVERIRGVIAELRPPMLDDYGLLATLRWCGQELASRTEIDVVVQGRDPRPRLPAAVEDALVRITQEALTNVAKHTQATRVAIDLTANPDRVRLTIQDDGLGFDPEQTDQCQSPHWGLLTMAERAAAVHGVCSIDSAPGEGTRVTVEVKR